MGLVRKECAVTYVSSTVRRDLAVSQQLNSRSCHRPIAIGNTGDGRFQRGWREGLQQHFHLIKSFDERFFLRITSDQQCREARTQLAYSLEEVGAGQVRH